MGSMALTAEEFHNRVVAALATHVLPEITSISGIPSAGWPGWTPVLRQLHVDGADQPSVDATIQTCQATLATLLQVALDGHAAATSDDDAAIPAAAPAAGAATYAAASPPAAAAAAAAPQPGAGLAAGAMNAQAPLGSTAAAAAAPAPAPGAAAATLPPASGCQGPGLLQAPAAPLEAAQLLVGSAAEAEVLAEQPVARVVAKARAARSDGEEVWYQLEFEGYAGSDAEWFPASHIRAHYPGGDALIEGFEAGQLQRDPSAGEAVCGGSPGAAAAAHHQQAPAEAAEQPAQQQQQLLDMLHPIPLPLPLQPQAPGLDFAGGVLPPVLAPYMDMLLPAAQLQEQQQQAQQQLMQEQLHHMLLLQQQQLLLHQMQAAEQQQQDQGAPPNGAQAAVAPGAPPAAAVGRGALLDQVAEGVRMLMASSDALTRKRKQQARRSATKQARRSSSGGALPGLPQHQHQQQQQQQLEDPLQHSDRGAAAAAGSPHSLPPAVPDGPAPEARQQRVLGAEARAVLFAALRPALRQLVDGGTVRLTALQQPEQQQPEQQQQQQGDDSRAAPAAAAGDNVVSHSAAGSSQRAAQEDAGPQAAEAAGAPFTIEHHQHQQVLVQGRLTIPGLPGLPAGSPLMGRPAAAAPGSTASPAAAGTVVLRPGTGSRSPGLPLLLAGALAGVGPGAPAAAAAAAGLVADPEGGAPAAAAAAAALGVDASQQPGLDGSFAAALPMPHFDAFFTQPLSQLQQQRV